MVQWNLELLSGEDSLFSFGLWHPNINQQGKPIVGSKSGIPECDVRFWFKRFVQNSWILFRHVQQIFRILFADNK